VFSACRFGNWDGGVHKLICPELGGWYQHRPSNGFFTGNHEFLFDILVLFSSICVEMLSFLSHVGHVRIHLIIIYLKKDLQQNCWPKLTEYWGYHTAIIISWELLSMDMHRLCGCVLEKCKWSKMSAFLKIVNVDAWWTLWGCAFIYWSTKGPNLIWFFHFRSYQQPFLMLRILHQISFARQPWQGAIVFGQSSQLFKPAVA